MRTLKRSVRNVRSGTIQSQNFNSRAEIHFEDVHISVRDQNTLIDDSGADLIAFCSGPCNLYMDGTFKVCPLLYDQIYTIHVEKNGIFSIAMVYIFTGLCLSIFFFDNIYSFK